VHTALSTSSLWPVLLANSALLAKVNDQRPCTNRMAGRPKESSVKFAGRGRLTLGFRGIEVGPMGLFSLACV